MSRIWSRQRLKRVASALRFGNPQGMSLLQSRVRKSLFCALAGIVACLLSACATTGAVLRMAQAQQNTAVVLAFLDTVFNKHEVAQAFKRYVGPYYRQHNPNVADGIEGAITALTRLTRDVFPELHQEVKRTVAQGDLVAVQTRQVRYAIDQDSARGVAVMDVFRLERGKIVEHWDVVEDIPEKSANDNSMF